MEMLNNGPIPGENYTSDTRNYPWHRPPDIVDIDEAVEYIGKRIFKPKTASGILTLLEMGMTVAMVTQNIVMKGMSEGKWTFDMGLLLAGPIARMIDMMAEDAGIDYKMGIKEDTTPIVPPASVLNMKNKKKYDTPSSKDAKKIIEEVKAPATGFQPPKE